MGKESRFVVATVGAVALAVGAITTTVLLRGQQSSQAAHANETAGQRFKNVQVLKDIPANQLGETMAFISDSLGVRCDYCHVRADFSKDDKRSKLTARKMIQMELAINRENFGGHTEVTCYTCHRGLTHPVGVPAIGEAGPSAATAMAPAEADSAGANSSPAPTSDEILAKYLQALGGADAVGKLTSRIAKGTFTAGDGKPVPLELFAKAPGKLLLVVTGQDGHVSKFAYEGTEGWGGDDQHVGPLRGGQLGVMESQAKLAFPVDLKESLGRLRVGRPEKLGDQEMNVLYAAREGQPPVKLYFDRQSGLLERVETFTRTPLGNDPNAVDYSDYRETDGVKVPCHWAIGAPQNRMTIQLDTVQQNAEIDDSKFAPPAGRAASGGGS